MMFSLVNPVVWSVVEASQKFNTLLPNGVPNTLPWKINGRIVNGIIPPVGYQYLTPWGVLQRAEGSSLNPDRAIGIRNLQCWLLLTSGEWVLHDSVLRVAGQLYPENFDTVTTPAIPAPSYSAPPTSRITQLQEGRAYHFYTSLPRKPVVAANLLGIATVYEAKLISKSGVDLTSDIGSVIATAGCDWWNQAELGGSVDSSFVSSYQTVTTSWRKIYGTMLRFKTAQQYGFPEEFTQLTQIDPIGIEPNYIAQ